MGFAALWPTSSAFPENNQSSLTTTTLAHNPYSPATTSTGIDPTEETVTGGRHRQFPLKLAWACTVCKVCAKQYYACLRSLHQAYVALSCVSSLSGLVIQNFAGKAVYCKDCIQEALTATPRFPLEDTASLTCPSKAFTGLVHTTAAATLHYWDLAVWSFHARLRTTQEMHLAPSWVRLTVATTPHWRKFKKHNMATLPSTALTLFLSMMWSLQNINIECIIRHSPQQCVGCHSHVFVQTKPWRTSDFPGKPDKYCRCHGRFQQGHL